MATGKLDQDGFLALSNSKTTLPRCGASSVSRNALAFATALAITGSAPVTLREKYTEKASSPTHPRADANRIARLRSVRPCNRSWNWSVLMAVPRCGLETNLGLSGGDGKTQREL